MSTTNTPRSLHVELPSHPEAEDAEHGRPVENKMGWPTMLVLGILAAIVLLVVVLHLLGVVGPGAR